MKVLVGIPSFRRPGMLAQLLASLERQQGLDGIALEVFVADNDAERREAAGLCVELRSAYPHPLDAAVVETKGISASRNRILAEARARGADLLAMIDDDETASPGWLAALVAAHRAYRSEVVGGPVLYAFAKPIGPTLAHSGAFPLKRRPSGPIPLLDASGNVLIDCAALARIGWPRFDLGFGLTGGEDREFFTRLRQAGFAFAWADEAIAEETVPPERLRTGSVLRRAFSVGNADYRIDALHGSGSAPARHLAQALIVLAAGVGLAPALLLPRYRLRLLRRYARALGKLSAAAGRVDKRYAVAALPLTAS